MLRIIICLIIAGVAGYFTRPEELAMREAANAAARPATSLKGFASIGATVAGDRVYSNYYVASKYSVALDGRTLVDCWGAFTQVKCDRAAQG